MSEHARGTFEVRMDSPTAALSGAAQQMTFTKTWTGDVDGGGEGVMTFAGDPASGNAGYTAVEVVRGAVGAREGMFCLLQRGQLRDGDQSLEYEIASGSGSGELAGITGTLHLTVDGDGVHHYDLEYALPG